MFILSQNQDEIYKGDFFDIYSIVKEGKSYFIQGEKRGIDDLMSRLRVNLAEYPTFEAAKGALEGLLFSISRGENVYFPDYYFFNFKKNK